MGGLLWKWVLFGFLVSLIPTFILTGFFGLIGWALYLGVMALLWGYTQRRLLTPLCGRDRAQQWQTQTRWGFGSAAAIVLLVRLIVVPLVIQFLNSQSALLLSNQILNQLELIWLGIIVCSVPIWLSVVSFWQASWFEALSQRRWLLINLGLGLCLGASLGLTFYDVINQARISWVPLIPVFPEVLAYLIGTGLVMAYALALEQQPAPTEATPNTTAKLPNFPPLPGLTVLGEVPLLVVYLGIVLIAVAIFVPLFPNLIFLTLVLLLSVAYQLGHWLHPWARRSSLMMTGVALLPFLGLAIANLGRNQFTFYLVVILVILGISLLSWLAGALVHWRSQNLRVAGGIMFLGPTVSLAFAALTVLIARWLIVLIAR